MTHDKAPKAQTSQTSALQPLFRKTELYVCTETPDISNPRERGRSAIRTQDTPSQEVAVVTLNGYKVGCERSPDDWAHLFAAAPELLEALELVKRFPNPTGHSKIELHKIIDAALAKAYGGDK